MLRICPILLILAFASSVRADEPGKEIARIRGKLTSDDPKDTRLKSSFRQMHALELKAGQAYRFDLTSDDFDTFLRLEDQNGKVLGVDDDGGPGTNSRLIYQSDNTQTCQIVVTSYEGGSTGKYTLIVSEAGPGDVLTFRAKKIAFLGKEEQAKLLEETKNYLADKGPNIGGDEVKLAMQICMSLEGKRNQLAPVAYSELAPLLARSGNKQVAAYARKLEGAARRIRLIGQEIVVKGTTLEGKEFDPKSMKGKVVLVDFWATWCGPCRAEFPNMRKMYQTYKDKGFEIVGISIDQNRAALEKFQEKEKLPWICLHEKDSEDGHPLADYYGVFYIPLAILVGPDGRVVSTTARGGELTRLLEKLLGPAD